MKLARCLFTLSVAMFLCLGWFLPNAWSAISANPSPADDPGAQPSNVASVLIPGPLRSFMRMAGISQKVSQEEVVPLLAHNVFTQGYEGSQTKGRPTEFLILLIRYVHQAKELTALAGADGMIHVSHCDEAKPLLHVLGYRVRRECGQRDTSVVTDDPERAFVTIDSGFPLPELEETLQGGKPFAYQFSASRVPVLFKESDWTAASTEDREEGGGLVETLLRDPVLARLYWALSRSDHQTRIVLQQSLGLGRLVGLAATLDFYGSHIRIRSGRVIVPGSTGAESVWKDLAGASPDSPKEFVARLLAKDNGWRLILMRSHGSARRSRRTSLLPGCAVTMRPFADRTSLPVPRGQLSVRPRRSCC